MQILAPSLAVKSDWKQAISTVASQANLQPFTAEVISFLESLSKSILLDHQMRGYPELMAVAYWLRRGHIHQLFEKFKSFTETRYLAARGMVVHFAPANVDSVFVYSWVMSLLMGNKNIIRLSQRRQPQMEILIQKINAVLMLPEYVQTAQRTLFVSYKHETEYTAFLSQYCQLRVLWGGDQAVRSIRAIPIPPNAVELVFPNRYSKAVLQANKVLELAELEQRQLAKKFYNDSFWYQQMACSSPKEVYWVGETNIIQVAKTQFWKAIDQLMHEEHYQNDPALNILRLTTADYYATKPGVGPVILGDYSTPVRVSVKEVDESFISMHCGGALFLEFEIERLADITHNIRMQDQTISYWGFERYELVNMVDQIQNRGVDRVVPIGQALAFSPVWDGYDLMVYFSREVVIG
ncbi:acyl-CoA reductase [Paenibacillus pabuli]|uniref:acyl-CoA reductase n=1 Tax=Paenibacillus pabuli TaxID=1472 RepID=UPI000783E411|nr:acyl-CoA reductase [Paenibacillus pabuli]MEC0129064.1 acyl-CoA reductase [Paenibacillus pabuli]